MKTAENQFRYGRSCKIINWGCSFDSLTEMKFAISIMNEYEFLRARIAVYYHPGTRKPVDYIRQCHRRYTPDFLIRHKKTLQAYWVEIKPRGFQNNPKLGVMKEVAENYIRWKKYDWNYKIIFDDEIFLSAEQWEEFQDCLRLKSASARKMGFEKYNRKFDRSAPSFFPGVPSDTDIHFVMFGTRREKKQYVK